MPLNIRGSFEQINTPNPTLLPDAAADAVRRYSAAALEAQHARRSLHELESPTAMGRARNEDVQSFKTTQKPTHAAVDRLREDIEDAQQMAQAFLELALDAEHAMLDAVRTAERPDPEPHAVAARESVDDCEAALRRATEAQALVAWMSDPSRPFGTGQHPAVQSLREVRRLLAPRPTESGVHHQTGFAPYNGAPAPEFRESNPYRIGTIVAVVDEVGS